MEKEKRMGNLMSAYSVYDKEVKVFNTPFFAQSDIHAKRSFEQIVRDEKSVIHQFKDKFTLYEVGLFDQENGEMTAITPTIILNATAIGE